MANTDILSLARELHSNLLVFVGDDPTLKAQLASIILKAEQNPDDTSIENQIDALFLDYPDVYEWMQNQKSEAELADNHPGTETFDSRGKYQSLLGPPPGVFALKYRCPVCDSRWSQMHKDEVVPNCNRHNPSIARIPVNE